MHMHGLSRSDDADPLECRPSSEHYNSNDFYQIGFVLFAGLSRCPAASARYFHSALCATNCGSDLFLVTVKAAGSKVEAQR